MRTHRDSTPWGVSMPPHQLLLLYDHRFSWMEWNVGNVEWKNETKRTRDRCRLQTHPLTHSHTHTFSISLSQTQSHTYTCSHTDMLTILDCYYIHRKLMERYSSHQCNPGVFQLTHLFFKHVRFTTQNINQAYSQSPWNLTYPSGIWPGCCYYQ